jgi:hypothetical protein
LYARIRSVLSSQAAVFIFTDEIAMRPAADWINMHLIGLMC